MQDAKLNNADLVRKPIVRDLESAIRDLIDVARPHNVLMREHGKWNQLCSSLDVIGDTTLGIDAYVDGGISAADSEHSVGTMYLLIYGLLQVLVVQQDAVSHLHDALDLPFDVKKHPKLLAIRDARNASTGHPTRRDRPKGDPVSYHFISRITLNHAGFQLLSSDDQGSNVFSSVDVLGLIDDQRTEVSDLLRAIADELNRREVEHKTAYRMEKLADTFSHKLGYAFEKLGDAARDTGPRELGIWALDEVEQSVNDFRESLAHRGYATDESSWAYLFEEFTYPIEQLRRYLQLENSDITSGRLAEMAVFFIRSHIDELRNLALEIDKDYAVSDLAEQSTK